MHYIVLFICLQSPGNWGELSNKQFNQPNDDFANELVEGFNKIKWKKGHSCHSFFIKEEIRG